MERGQMTTAVFMDFMNSFDKVCHRSLLFKGEVRRKMNFTYVLGFLVLRDVVKVFVVSSSSFARKTTGRKRARSH